MVTDSTDIYTLSKKPSLEKQCDAISLNCATTTTTKTVASAANPTNDSPNTLRLNSSLVQNLAEHKNEPFVWADARFGKSASHPEVSAVAPSNNHLINAFVNAYNTHLSLKLSPDHILLAIGHTASTYINKNSEALRSRFVDQEKKELRVVQSTEDWDRFVTSMAKLVRDNIKVNWHPC